MQYGFRFDECLLLKEYVETEAYYAKWKLLNLFNVETKMSIIVLLFDTCFERSITTGFINCNFHDRMCHFRADVSFVIQWASDLACQLLAIHNEEVARRKDFQGQFEGHFLSTLLPGMEDLPPPFATQAPSPFDLDLPKV